jgi:Mg-chelatase subunit ChlD
VSLGILLDASGSMNTEKLKAAQAAISHLVFDLLEKATNCSSSSLDSTHG